MDGDCCADARFALDGHGSLVLSDDGAADGKAETHAALPAVAPGIGAIEAFPQMREMGRVDPAAGVLHTDDSLVLAPLQRHANLPVRRGIADRVLQQIKEEAAKG